MSQNLQSILEAARRLPPDELRQLVEKLVAEVSGDTELRFDDQLRQEVLEAELQITRGEVAPWSEVKHRHGL
jgi:hypothetical protein